MKSHSRTAGQHSFSRIQGPEIQRSSFNRNCGVKTTLNAGLLVPFFVEEALPGDTMNLKCHNYGRLATPLHPILDNLHLETFFFSVPYRLVWENWEKFNGAQDDPGDSTDFLIPQCTKTSFTEEDIFDYMGIPVDGTHVQTFSALPFRAYNLIWNTWFRSQNLQDSLDVRTNDGPDANSIYAVRRRGKRQDYFTSALPFPQKGDSVLLPLGASAPVTITDSPVTGTGDLIPEFSTGGGAVRTLEMQNSVVDLDWDNNTSAAGSAEWDDTKLEVTGATGTADLSTATAATINQIRQAFQVQRLLERDARGGTRYVELIKSHFGVVSPDFRLQRPEYLGGGSQPINVTPVPQTSETLVGTAQGNLAAFGTTSGSNHGFVKSFDEHCIVIGIVCVRADLNYQQGMPRQFSRLTRFDHYLPALAHLGEQTILNKEIFAVGAGGATDDDAVFGYQERWAEYRYKPSMVTGQMRSSAATSLDTWHLSQDFSALPVLDATFIEENPPIARIIAVPSEPHLLWDAWMQFTHARPIPTFSTPGMIDHF